MPTQCREPADDVAKEPLLFARSELGHPVWKLLVSAIIKKGQYADSRYCPPDVGAMDASSASEAASVKVHIQVARYSHMVPARPPLIRENRLVINMATQVDIVVMASPSTENDLKLRRNSCERPRRSISRASASFPVATPEISTRTCASV